MRKLALLIALLACLLVPAVAHAAEGYDHAWGRIPATTVKAHERSFVAGYLSYSPAKNLSVSEVNDLSRHGVSSVVVWETTAGRALAGYTAGRSDAGAALSQATALGMPRGRPIYFAVDFDGQPSQQARLNAYFRGARDVLGRDRVGAYGGYFVIKRLFDARLVRYGWQTYAWSRGLWDRRAQLRQYSNGHQVAGVGVDYDRSVARDFGQWRLGWVPAPAKRPPTRHARVLCREYGHYRREVKAGTFPEFRRPRAVKVRNALAKAGYRCAIRGTAVRR